MDKLVDLFKELNPKSEEIKDYLLYVQDDLIKRLSEENRELKMKILHYQKREKQLNENEEDFRYDRYEG